MPNQYSKAFAQGDFNGARGRYRKWCPNGCGKSVVFYPQGNTPRKHYKCERCEEWFDKKQLL